MKYIITTLLIFFLFSCEPQVVYKDKKEQFKAEHNFEYITLDDCEYLMGNKIGYNGYSFGYMSKIDCNCVPNKN
jgi:hypothetical protein